MRSLLIVGVDVAISNISVMCSHANASAYSLCIAT